MDAWWGPLISAVAPLVLALTGPRLLRRLRCLGAERGGGAGENSDCGDVVSGCTVERRLVNGLLPAELLWATPGGCSTENGALIVLVPGFPGIGLIYADFLSVLATSSGCSAVCVAWSGQHAMPSSLKARAAPGRQTMEDQAAFFIAVLFELRALPWVSKLVLVGHSLGTWFAARALAALDDADGGGGLPVVAVHLVCPILEDMFSIPRAQRLMRLKGPVRVARALHMDAVLRGAIWLFPGACAMAMHVLWWLRGKAALERSERWFWHTAVAHLRLGVLGRAASLALEARTLISAPDAWINSLRERGDRVCLHYAAGDAWTPAFLQVRLAQENRLPRATYATHCMPHGIITNRGAAREFAVEMGRLIATQT